MSHRQIDHDPNEPKIDRSNTVFYAAWAVVAVGWILTLYIGDLHWQSAGLGALTAAVLIITHFEKFGNKWPPGS